MLNNILNVEIWDSSNVEQTNNPPLHNSFSNTTWTVRQQQESVFKPSMREIKLIP